jgi:hypothetical protein
MVRLTSVPAAALAVKSRSHFQVSDSDSQVVLTSRKLHPIVCNSEPSIPVNAIRRLLRVSPTFLGFEAELICFERHRKSVPLSSGGLRSALGLHPAHVTKRAQRAIPKLDPSPDAVARGAQGPFVPLRRVRYQIVKQLLPHRTVTVAIEFDVPLDIVDEIAQAILVVLSPRESLLKPAEHLRDNVLSAVKKCRDDLFR